jgi:COP9 signalosome complex subunit 4
MSIQRKLEDISSISIQKDKSTAYSALLSDILVKSRSTADVQAVLRSAVNETPVVARQVLSELVKSLNDANFPDSSVLQSLLRAALEVAQPRGVTFEEQVCQVCVTTYRNPHSSIRSLR